MIRQNDNQAVHLAVFDDKLVAVSSFFNQNQKEELEEGYWKIRGMAVAPKFQGQGLGKSLISYFIDHNDVKELWCNARQGVEEFYLKLGFRSTGMIDRDGNMVYRMVKSF